MNSLTEALSGALGHLGQTFLLAYYLPAAVFLLVNVQLLAPIWGLADPLAGASQEPAVAAAPSADAGLLADAPNQARQTGELTSGEQSSLLGALGSELSNLLGALFLPMLVGLILVALNDALIIVFEGRPRWLRRGLLVHWQRRNEQQCRVWYGQLTELRKQYRYESHRLMRADSDDDRLQLEQLLGSLADQIREEHSRIDGMAGNPPLPRDPERVMPTTFGNIYAMAEEYPYDCYGADSVLFWPRLREQMHEYAEGHSERLTAAKTFLDISINLTFLAGIVVLETIATVGLMLFRGQPVLLPAGMAVLALIVTSASYRSAISRMALLGELIKNSFDTHRHLALNAFGLQQPATLAAERFVWDQLAAFVRRGEPSYFPEQFRKAAEDSEAASQSDESQGQTP